MRQSNQEHPTVEDRQRQDEESKLEGRMGEIAHKLLVLSGKGGVGKSTVAANLAAALARAGKRVGLLDIDLHGPSIPRLLGLEGTPLESTDEAMVPVMVNENLGVMSIGFLLPTSRDAVIWRGPRKHGVIRQFLADVAWGALDYLVVDSPPGTGDEPLSIAQLVGSGAGAVVVTTPQEVAVADVRRCIEFCHTVSLPVVGVVENMSGLVCPQCGLRIDLFKRGGGMALARETNVRFLGEIPIDPQVVMAGDAGTPLLGNEAESPAAKAFADIVGQILASGSQISSRHNLDPV